MRYKSLLLDIINLFVGFFPIALAFTGTFLIGQSLEGMNLIIPFILSSIFIYCLLYIAFLWIVRLIVPRMEEGSHALSFNKGFLAWVLHRSLYRSVEMSMVKKIILNFNTLKFLLFKALGANIKFDLNIALDADIYDYGLVTIGSDVTLGARSIISCHNFSGQKLVLKRVTIGSKILIGFDTVVSPGTVIEDESFIGPRNILNGEIIKSGTKLLPCEWSEGSPQSQERLKKLKESLQVKENSKK